MTREKRRRLLCVQRFAGLFCMAVSLFIIYMASNGTNVIDRDATPVLLFLPAGFVYMFSKSVVIPEDADEVIESAAKAVKREVKYFVADCIDFVESKIK